MLSCLVFIFKEIEHETSLLIFMFHTLSRPWGVEVVLYFTGCSERQMKMANSDVSSPSSGNRTMVGFSAVRKLKTDI